MAHNEESKSRHAQDSGLATQKPNKNDVHFAGLNSVHLVILLSLVLISHYTFEAIKLNAGLISATRQLNNTITAEKEVLFFNRVPKVGSQTIMNMLKVLGKANKFSHFVDSDEIKKSQGEQTFLEKPLLMKYGEIFLHNITEPGCYNKHISFINFKELDSRFYQPIYVNFVREPVQRIISWYYYVRAPWYIFNLDPERQQYSEIKPEYMSSTGFGPKWLKQSYEECVYASDPECQFIEGRNSYYTEAGGSHASQMMFFCGHAKHCAIINDKRALRDAIRNVEEHFAVVGVLEEMDKSLLVLEHYIPRFFSGAPLLYRKHHYVYSQVNKNKFRPSVSAEVKAMLRRNLTREVEFYEFCKQRLHKQYLALGLQ